MVLQNNLRWLKHSNRESLQTSYVQWSLQEQTKIDNMLTQNAKVIVIGAEDGKQLTGQVEAAEAAGIPVIAYDRPIDAEGTDYYVAFDNFKVGQLQGTALLEGLAKLKGDGPYNIELFAGAATDANAPVFFNGAMDVLQPKIDDEKGQLNVSNSKVLKLLLPTEANRNPSDSPSP